MERHATASEFFTKSPDSRSRRPFHGTRNSGKFERVSKPGLQPMNLHIMVSADFTCPQIASVGRFSRLERPGEDLPGEVVILRFRHLPERHRLAEGLLLRIPCKPEIGKTSAVLS